MWFINNKQVFLIEVKKIYLNILILADEKRIKTLVAQCMDCSVNASKYQ